MRPCAGYFNLGCWVARVFWSRLVRQRVWAQDADELADIKAEIAAIQSNLARVSNVTAKLTTQLESTTARLDALQSSSSQNTGDLRKLEEKVETAIVENVKDLDDKLEQLRHIVDDISAQTPGGYVPNLGQMQMNQSFGEVTVRNQMTSPQMVSINGEEHWVQPLGGTITVNVRPGVVSTSLPGFEAPRAWNVGPANGYKVRVDIVPRP